jgi:hypothetical protein
MAAEEDKGRGEKPEAEAPAAPFAKSPRLPARPRVGGAARPPACPLVPGTAGPAACRRHPAARRPPPRPRRPPRPAPPPYLRLFGRGDESPPAPKVGCPGDHPSSTHLDRIDPPRDGGAGDRGIGAQLGPVTVRQSAEAAGQKPAAADGPNPDRLIDEGEKPRRYGAWIVLGWYSAWRRRRSSGGRAGSPF